VFSTALACTTNKKEHLCLSTAVRGDKNINKILIIQCTGNLNCIKNHYNKIFKIKLIKQKIFKPDNYPSVKTTLYTQYQSNRHHITGRATGV
jgi:hypothetical protein